MLRNITGVSSRSLIKLALISGYLAMMMASLFGASPTRAQVTATVTITPTPASMLTPVASTLMVKPDTLAFGFQVVLPPDGATGKPNSVTLSVAKNQPQAVTIEQPLMVSDTSGPPPQFIVQANNCSTIAPGQSCEVPIVFQPNGLHVRKALLLITSNASNGVLSVNLTGHGKQGILTIKPTGLSFPVGQMGGPPSQAKMATITNKNTVPVTIHGISSSNASVFPMTEDCPPVLAPSASCTVSVSFMADRNGAIGGQINLSDNAAGPNRINLSGSGRGFPVVTRTPHPTQTPRPTATMSPAAFPMRAFPVTH